MKKTFLGVLATLTVLSMNAATVFGAGPGNGPYFTDADKDGICDNAVCVYEGADEDGICDVCGAAHGNCQNREGAAFADEDGDGICDHYASGECQSGKRDRHQSGRGYGCRGGRCR